MRFTVKPLLIALALSGQYSPSLLAAANEPHSEAANAAVNRILAVQGAQLQRAEARYAELIRSGASLQTAINELVTSATEQSRAETTKATASERYFTAAVLAWHLGDLDSAARYLQQSVKLQRNLANLQLLAALQDAQGQRAAAQHSYQQLLPLLQQPSISADAKALINALSAQISNGVPDNGHNLSHPPAFAAAELAALNGDMATANSIALQLNHQHLSVAQRLEATDWLLASNDYADAAKLAWAAFTKANGDADRRYALALFTEAWRGAGDLAAAEQTLAGTAQNALIQNARVDLLLELGKYDAALQVIDGSDAATLQHRRSAVLALADRSDELQQSYRQQIAADSQDLAPVNGLAASFINQGDSDKAIALYQQFAKANQTNLPLLLQAAKRMIAMGLTDAAIALVEHHSAPANRNTNVSLQLFLFDTYLSQGEQQAAAAVLARLDKTLAANSLTRLSLAENYERLQQPQTALACLIQLEQARGHLSYDQALHIASLAYSSGDKAAALRRWKALWQQAKLPARRNFLERRIVDVAGELKQLKPLTQQLAAAVSNNTTSAQQLDLLISFYLAQHQVDNAVAAVATFAKQNSLSSVARLQYLASIYGREHNYRELNRVWQQLAELQPEQAGQYWQQITLNSLRNNVFEAAPQIGLTPKQQRTQQIDALLQKLSQHGQQVDSQFAANLYAMAGLPERAISAYQRALVVDPNNSDNLLQLVALLKKQQAFSKAASLLQLTFITSQNSDTRFAAVDGLLNLFSSGEEPLPEQAQLLGEQVLQWLQRQLFAMLSSADNTEHHRVLMALAELGTQQGNYALTEQANRQLLARAPQQRAAILRSLVSQFSGASEPEVSSGPTIGDNAKKLQYGRRLLAMQQEFPPSLYSDLAQSLLADGDILGAERAFSMMIDIPGIVNVKQEKGLAYANAGFEQQALTYLQQALVTEQNNLGLLLNTAILQQQLGKTRTAHHWYWQGLQALIAHQPVASNGHSAEIFSDLQRYFAPLAEGLLLTWPTDGQTATKVTRQLQQLLSDYLAAAQAAAATATQPLRLAQLPQLQATLELVQRLAAFNGDFSLLAQYQAQLTQLLAADDDFAQHWRSYWYFRGQPLSTASTAAHSTPMALLAVQAQVNDNFPLQLQLALAQQDWPAVLKLAQQVVAAHNRVAASPREQLLQAQYFAVLQQGYLHMPRALFMQQLWPLLMQVNDASLVQFQVLRYQPALYHAVEQATAPMLTHQQIIDLLLNSTNTPMPYGLNTAAGDNAFNHGLIEALDNPTLVDFFGKLVGYYQQQLRTLPIQTQVLQALLQRQLNAAQQQQLITQLLTSITFAPNGQVSAAAAASQLLLLDVAPRNQTVLLAAAKQLVQQRPECQLLLPLLQQYFAGERALAYQTLLQLHSQIGRGLGYDFAAPLIKRFFAKQQQARIDEFMALKQASSNDCNAFYNDIVRRSQQPPKTLAYLQQLVKLASDNLLYHSELLAALWQQQNYREFTAQLSRSLPLLTATANRADISLMQTLADAIAAPTAEAKQQAATTALAALGSDGVVAWLNQAANGAGIAKLYSQVFQTYAEQHSDNALIAELHQRQGSEQLMTPQQQGLALPRLAERFAQQPQQAVALLGTMWRNALPGRKQFGAANISRDELLHNRFDLTGNQQVHNTSLTQAADLLAEIAKLPSATAMFIDWLKAMPDEQAITEQRLFDLIVAGWQQQGVLAQQQQQLWQTLATEKMSLTQFQLLLTALTADNSASSSLTAKQLQQLSEQSRRNLLLPATMRLQLAQIFVAHDDYRVAGELLQAAAWQVNFATPNQASRMAAMQPKAINMQRIVDSIAQWRNKTAAATTLSAVIDVIPVGKSLSTDAQGLLRSFSASASAQVLQANGLAFMQQRHVELSADSPIAAIADSELYLQAGKLEHAAKLLADALAYRAPVRQWGGYDREQQQLANSLFGNNSGRTDDANLQPWLAALVAHSTSKQLTALLQQLAPQSAAFVSDRWCQLLLLAIDHSRSEGDLTAVKALKQMGAKSLPAQAQYAPLFQ